MFVVNVHLSAVLMVLLIILVSFWIVSSIVEFIEQRKNNKTLHEKVVNQLLEKASDDRPIVLSVNQEKIIERVIDEIERRQRTKEWFK